MAQADGLRRRRLQALEDAMFTAWHIAGFQRSKRLPALEPMLTRLRGSATPRRQSPSAQLEHVRTLTALFGGEDKTAGRAL